MVEVRIFIPSLFKLFGEGFADDLYAANGNHLRWVFDPRLGFPRQCFALYRSPSFGTRLAPRLPKGQESFVYIKQETVDKIVRGGLAVMRADSTLTITPDGVVLDGRPVVIDFHQGSINHPEPYACWVSLSFRFRASSASFQASAKYVSRGLEEVVDEVGQAAVGARSVEIALKADRIDRIAVVGKNAYLTKIVWTRTVDLIVNEKTGSLPDGWKKVGTYPLPTKNPAYRERNSNCYESGVSAETLVKKRLLYPLPNGVEPLDAPRIPPIRSPTTLEFMKRYFDPWAETFEPWISGMLDQSADGQYHQMEYSLEAPLDEAGQTFGDGGLEELNDITENQTMKVYPYTTLLMASLAFPFARVLGLAEVDNPPSRLGIDSWDYMVVGGWLRDDILSWKVKLQRELFGLYAERESATPAEKVELERKISELTLEWIEATSITQKLSDAADGDDYVHLAALKIGVKAVPRPMYQRPSSLHVTDSGYPTSPLDREGVARLEWPLRQRARRFNKTLINEKIPMGAILVRRTGPAGSHEDILNPVDPVSKRSLLLIPEGLKDARGDGKVAVFLDRHAQEGIEYTYGVSEVDPFGRWSPFEETNFSWRYTIPPPVPAQMRATLAFNGSPSSATLELYFSWQADIYTPDRYEFDIHLSRVAPPSDDPHNRTNWGYCARIAGTSAPPFHFQGSFTGEQTHDGMAVSVSSKERQVTDGLGATYGYRDFTVRFMGLVLELDAIDRAQVWAGVSTLDETTGIASAEVGGPAKAECFVETQPELPELKTEKATYCDAQGISSYTLQWVGEDSMRYIVFRAGERELVQRLQNCRIDTSAYDPMAEPANRAGALKKLATDPKAREVFQTRSGLIPDAPRNQSGEFLEPKDWEDATSGGAHVTKGDRAFTDSLPGLLRTLTVYTVLGISRAGIMSEWPSLSASFFVVEVPIAREPTQPVIYGATWRPPQPGEPGDGFVELQIVEPPRRMDESGNLEQLSADVGSYEIYRTADQTKTQDYYFMRRLGGIDSPVYTPLTFSDPSYGSINVTTYTDRDIAPWTTYYYRAVARAKNPDESRPGMRSIASALVQAVVFSGSPPPIPSEVIAIHDPASGTISISFKAKLPKTSAGEFLVDIIGLDDAAPNGEVTKRTILKRLTATEVPAKPGPEKDAYKIDVEDKLMSGNSVTSIVIRVKDPLGHSSESAAASVR